MLCNFFSANSWWFYNFNKTITETINSKIRRIPRQFMATSNMHHTRNRVAHLSTFTGTTQTPCHTPPAPHPSSSSTSQHIPAYRIWPLSCPAGKLNGKFVCTQHQKQQKHKLFNWKTIFSLAIFSPDFLFGNFSFRLAEDEADKFAQVS